MGCLSELTNKYRRGLLIFEGFVRFQGGGKGAANYAICQGKNYEGEERRVLTGERREGLKAPWEGGGVWRALLLCKDRDLNY